jgi:hypothetical protein
MKSAALFLFTYFLLTPFSGGYAFAQSEEINIKSNIIC